MVNQKARKELLEAWRDGRNLRNALDLFQPQLDRRKLLEGAKEQRRVSAIGKRNFRQAGRNADQLLDALDTALLQLSAAAQAGESQKRKLIEALENGELIALGYPTDRPRADKPEPVPQFLIQLEFAKFGKSEFSDGEKRYARVRIVPGEALARPKIGRPSIRDRVTGIASELAKAGTINRAMPPKVQAGKIREYGDRYFPSDFTENNPAEQTIRRHLKSFWNSN